MYYPIVRQCIQALKNLETWLDKAEQHAAAKGFDVGVLLTSRLAPDMKDFIYQVQSACDYTKGAAAWLSGQKPPRHEDNEQTIDEVRHQDEIKDAEIGGRCRIGPYSRIRPATVLGDEVHIGNFVEVKASTIGARSKANHLAYIGDASVGRDVNVGAGTITCNYDGANKHRTVIEDDVHIGSDTQLIAPVTVRKGATIGAGATISREVPAGELTISQKKQVVVPGWKRPRKAQS